MSKLGYAIQKYDEKKMAKARINNAPVSLKIAIEICNMIRYKTTERAKKMLQDVIDVKQAVPYRKFNRAVAHKTATGPGRYPIKTSQEILTLIKIAEANAQNKGLSQNLVITHLAPNKGNTQWHHGRKRRRKVKSAHIEIVLQERKEQKKEQHTKKAEPKPEVKIKHEEKPQPETKKQEEHEHKTPHKTEKSEEKPHKTHEKKAHSKKTEAKTKKHEDIKND